MRHFDEETGRVYNVPTPLSFLERIAMIGGLVLIAAIILSAVGMLR